MKTKSEKRENRKQNRSKKKDWFNRDSDVERHFTKKGKKKKHD